VKQTDDCSNPGYLQELKIIHRIPIHETKYLPNGFTWSNIPMLSVITGINGIGKTAVLHMILNYYLCSRKILSMSKAVELKFRDANTNKRFLLHSTLQVEPYIAYRVSKMYQTDDILDVVASYMGCIFYINSNSNELCSIDSISAKISQSIFDPTFRADNRPWNILANLTDVKHFVTHLVKTWNVKAESLNKFLKENNFIYPVHTLARKYFMRIMYLFVN
jgi:hypothetical protein